MPLPIAREGHYACSNDVLDASAAHTSTFNSATFNSNAASGIVIEVNVSARSGTTPTLDVNLQDSPDGGTTWNTVSSLTQITATGVGVKRLNLRDTPVADLCRLNYTIGGTTPSFTFASRIVLVRN